MIIYMLKRFDQTVHQIFINHVNLHSQKTKETDDQKHLKAYAGL